MSPLLIKMKELMRTFNNPCDALRELLRSIIEMNQEDDSSPDLSLCNQILRLDLDSLNLIEDSYANFLQSYVDHYSLLTRTKITEFEVDSQKRISVQRLSNPLSDVPQYEFYFSQFIRVYDRNFVWQISEIQFPTFVYQLKDILCYLRSIESRNFLYIHIGRLWLSKRELIIFNDRAKH